MKPMQFWSAVLSLFIAVMVLGGYAYNVSAYAATLSEKVEALQRQRSEDKEMVKSNLDYIRNRVDEIYNRLPPANCGQCKDH